MSQIRFYPTPFSAPCKSAGPAACTGRLRGRIRVLPRTHVCREISLRQQVYAVRNCSGITEPYPGIFDLSGVRIICLHLSGPHMALSVDADAPVLYAYVDVPVVSGVEEGRIFLHRLCRFVDPSGAEQPVPAARERRKSYAGGDPLYEGGNVRRIAAVMVHLEDLRIYIRILFYQFFFSLFFDVPCCKEGYVPAGHLRYKGAVVDVPVDCVTVCKVLMLRIPVQ